MKSRKSLGRPVRPGAPPGAMAALAAVTDLPRQQMAVAAESACALLRGVEAMRQIQAEAAHRALDHHAAAAEKLKGPCQPADLLAVQADLLRFGLESSIQYSQQLGAAALETQNEMLGLCTHLVESEDVLHAAAIVDRLPDMVLGLTGPEQGSTGAGSS